MTFLFEGQPLSHWLKPLTKTELQRFASGEGISRAMQPATPKCSTRADVEELHRASMKSFTSATMPSGPANVAILDSSEYQCLQGLLFSEVASAADEAERHALACLDSLVGEIAGMPGVLASTCGLFLVTEKNTVKAKVLWNSDKPDGWELPLAGRGVVARIARTGVSEITNKRDPDYICINPSAESELAVAICYDGCVIGVLNLESIRPDCFAPETLRFVEQLVVAFIPHLLVLRSLDRGKGQWCPWHPEKHGWDLQDIVGRLCRTFRDGVDKASTFCTVWYVDHDKQQLFAYGTSGYDWPYHQNQRSLAYSGTSLEEFILGAEEVTLPIKLADAASFFDPEKAAMLEIEDGFLHNVIRDSQPEKQTIAAITVYFNRSRQVVNVDTRQQLTEATLPYFAALLSRLIVAYNEQRPLLAAAFVQAQQAALHSCSTAARLELLLQKTCEILQSPAASLFAHDSEHDVLLCIATTGFRKDVGPITVNTLNERDSTVQGVFIPVGDQKGHTIAAFRSIRRAVRRNRLSYPEEKGLTAYCPERGGSTRPEFIAGEEIAEWQHSKRRFLGCRILDGGEPIGVLRVVRPEKSCPFTKCDEILIESLVDQFSSLVRQSMQEMRTPAKNDDNIESAVEKPSSLSSQRVQKGRARRCAR